MNSCFSSFHRFLTWFSSGNWFGHFSSVFSPPLLSLKPVESFWLFVQNHCLKYPHLCQWIAADIFKLIIPSITWSLLIPLAEIYPQWWVYLKTLLPIWCFQGFEQCILYFKHSSCYGIPKINILLLSNQTMFPVFNRLVQMLWGELNELFNLLVL